MDQANQLQARAAVHRKRGGGNQCGSKPIGFGSGWTWIPCHIRCDPRIDLSADFLLVRVAIGQLLQDIEIERCETKGWFSRLRALVFRRFVSAHRSSILETSDFASSGARPVSP